MKAVACHLSNLIGIIMKKEMKEKTTRMMRMRNMIVICLLCLPLSVAAQWGGGSRGTAKSSEPFVTLGLCHTGDFYKSLGVGMGLMCNFGRTNDLLNLSFGAEYIEYVGADPRPKDKQGTMGLADIGGQIVFPVMLKLQLFRTSKWTKFYIAGGGEYGLRAHDGGVVKHFYEEETAFNDHSLAVIPMIGWRARNVDFGFYCKYYLDKPFHNSLDGKKNLGDEEMRFGYHVTWWF